MTLGLVSLIGLLGFWFIRRRIEDDAERRFVTSLYVIALIAILVSLPVIDWRYMPGILWQMQFPWRTLMVSTVLLAVVSGYTIYLLLKNASIERQRVAVIAVGLLAIYAVTPLVMPRAERHLDNIDAVKQDPVTLGWEAEYAPMQLLCSPDKKEDVAQGYACSLSRVRKRLAERGNGLRVISGSVNIAEATKDGLKMDLKIDNSSDVEAVVELPMIYYPGYKAVMDGNELTVGYSTEYGLVTVTIPARTKGEVKVYYGLSLATELGVTITAATIVLSVGWLAVSGVRNARERRKEAELMQNFAEMREAVASSAMKPTTKETSTKTTKSVKTAKSAKAAKATTKTKVVKAKTKTSKAEPARRSTTTKVRTVKKSSKEAE